MRLLDRYILKSFMVNYVLALGVLLGMYVLFDLIVNIRDFAGGLAVSGAASTSSGWDIVRDMLDYYFYQLPLIFQQVSGIIPLVAAGFTMVRLTRHHELTAMLASGVSLYRVAAPIILASMIMSVINVCNQEFLISQPFMIDKLMRKHDEVNVVSAKNAQLNFIRESDQSLLTARDSFALKGITLLAKAPNTFSRPAGSGSFIADKLKRERDREIVVITSGFAEPANNGAFIITDMTDSTLTVTNGTLVKEGPTVVNAEVVFVASRNDPLMFVKDSDDSLLSAREYYPIRHVKVSVKDANTVVRPAGTGSFLGEGVRKGMVVELGGFANKANNGHFTVAAVDNSTVTFANSAFVPEAASSDSTLVAGGSMVGVIIVYRNDSGIPIRHTLAATAHWEIPPTPDAATEAWVLRKVVTEDDTGRRPDARPLEMSVRTTSTLSPEQIDLILSRKEVDYLSSARVRDLAIHSPEVNRPLLYKIMHLRFTQPLMNIVLLLVGIPFLLTREPNKLVFNMFYCVAVTGVIFVATFVMFQMAGTQIKDPLLGTWLPVLIFGPFSLVMLDFVQT